ncbi:hypothetical protein C8J36_101121 [Rhizobium sp. PP-F2F-G48]|uniref:Acb2/Tad1 domain-containing protein n=1 Tax=Rhizobium sp. PP-F2F-G48 TaxID=2135651 RepID=UPI00105097CD|nr:hypothetical protein [Rhizobium sp. PP-F2F-G48]TCM58222.1 hypothetical protein C8J36_101121 [Rhizobium sp. PP-F2F-G48]
MSTDTVRATYKPLTDLQKEQMATVKSCGQELIEIIDGIGPGRETSLAKTKVEEAVMWATKAVTAQGSIE